MTRSARFVAFVAAVAVLRTTPAGADGRRDSFIASHLCETLSRLARIHDRGPRDTSKDRFLIVGLGGRPDSYVQCLFFDLDRKMLCEASSGAYRYPDDSGVLADLAPASLIALDRLGFVLPQSRGNFTQELELESPPHLDRAATLILTTLYDAYEARLEDELTFTAPMANETDGSCTPRS